MSDISAAGPANPSRIVFVAIALVGIAVGLGTGDLGWFILAVVGSAILFCVGYSLVRRRLGWKPLNADYLADLIRLLGPH